MPSSVYSTHHYQYINNVFGRFISGLANYFKTELIPRSKDGVISTYEKAIEHFRNRKNFGGEKWAPQYPFIVVDPQMDFEPDPQAGRFFHGYPNFMQKFASRMYNPVIYEDNNLRMAPVLNRYRGTIDVHIYSGTVYEMMDERAHILQIFGGYGRPIFPFSFESIIVIPEEYKNYEYKNPFTNDTYNINWDYSGSTVETLLLRNINKEELCFPTYITPWLTLTSVSDAADKYGGSGDIIGTHHQIVSIEWEASIPTHVVFEAKYVPIPSIPMEFTVPTRFKTVKNPITKESINIAYDLDSVADFGDVSGHPVKLDLTFDQALNYTLTTDDITALNDTDINIIEIPIGISVTDERFVRISWRGNWLDRDIVWRCKSTDHTILELIGVESKAYLEEGDNLTILIYKEETYD